MKKISLLISVILISVSLSGCGGGGGSSDIGEKTVANTDILALLSKYETAVEAYDVNGMLKCLDSSSFNLTITEGSYTNTKNYVTLKKELEEDEDNQLMWRKDSTVAGGHKYKLDLKLLGAPTSGNETASGAIVKQNFEVWESSDEVNPAIMTDSGTIVWTLVQSSGEWKVMAMIINYNTGKINAAFKAARTVGGTGEKGFGFDKVRL